MSKFKFSISNQIVSRDDDVESSQFRGAANSNLRNVSNNVELERDRFGLESEESEISSGFSNASANMLTSIGTDSLKLSANSSSFETTL